MEVATIEKAKIRILCLHGFFNNIDTMNHQLRHYRKLFDKYISFVPINGPHECTDVFDKKIAEMFKPPFFGWYFYNPKTNECKGIEESIQYIVQYINTHGPFDGVLGFSQGTIMARIILKLSEFESEVPKIEVGAPKFGIVFSGIFTEKAKYFSKCKEDSLNIMNEYEQPMLYVYGEKDPLIEYVEKALVKEGDFTIVKHHYAHNIPKLRGEFLKEFCSFFDRMYYNIIGKHMDLDFGDFNT
ncbi:unnamed protein product [Moneuplotes crassus]|uniref:Serine hydrolase domain-containing protein n=1 Tax=Euplotes crassus TaxID=5936 RepID=A0AAD2D2N0_EUPCR|nr:unnamed protein product [Moneuplotes crassus]